MIKSLQLTCIKKSILLKFPSLLNLDCFTTCSKIPQPAVLNPKTSDPPFEQQSSPVFSDFFKNFYYLSSTLGKTKNIELSSPQSYWISRTSGNCIFMPLVIGCMKVVLGISSLWSFSSRCCIFAKWEGGTWDACSLMGGASTAGITNTNLARRKESVPHLTY